MSSIVKDLDAEVERVRSLREKQIPKYRQAYSDRTAWLMACMSELAYIRFNPGMSDASKRMLKLAAEQILNAQSQEKVLSILKESSHEPEEERRRLERGLEVLSLSLEKTFDQHGTQAILVSCEDFIVIAFRGTEATSVKDIKADANGIARDVRERGKVHSGFDDAFEEVRRNVQASLDDGRFDDRPLFVTGHSLGGALATLGARRLIHKGGIAACYTFGSPRVGDENWVASLKTPIYRSRIQMRSATPRFLANA